MNQSGLSLISTLVASAIMGILVVGFASLFEMQQKEVRFLNQKLETLDFKQMVLKTIQNPTNCSCQLNASLNTSATGTLAINTTGASIPDIDLGVFRSGCDFSSTNNILAQQNQPLSDFNSSIRISSVRVTNIAATGTTNEFTGNLVFNYDQNSLVRNIQPVQVGLRMTIDPTNGTPASRPISSCASENSSSASSCPSGYTMIGDPSERGSFCISTNPEPQISSASASEAAKRCANKNPTAKLCSLSEWLSACNEGTANGMRNPTSFSSFEITNQVFFVTGAVRAVTVAGRAAMHSIPYFCGAPSGGTANPQLTSGPRSYRCCIH